MFTYADLSKTGHDHFLFNTGYFTVLQHLFPEDEVTLQCDISHFNYIKEAIDIRRVQHKPVYILRKHNNKLLFLFRWLYKNLYDFLILYFILKRSSRQNERFVFFAMMPVRSMWYLLFWHRFFFRNQQVILTFHGEIEKWFLPHKSVTERFHAYIFKQLFTYKNPKLKFFVPNAFIRENLRKEPLFRNKDILTIYHLLHPRQSAKTLQETPVVLAHIGSTEPRKNSDCFFRLASLVTSTYPDLTKSIQFKVAGKYNPVFDPLLEREVIVLADQQRILERDYFDAAIDSAHFSVIFIYPHEYLYRESGTVLESLKFSKPIIGLRHPYLDFLEAQCGPIGIYADTLEALATAINDLFSDPLKAQQQYELMVRNIAALHAQITLPVLAAGLAGQMRATGIPV